MTLFRSTRAGEGTLPFVAFVLGPIALQVLVRLASLIPYVGPVFRLVAPGVAFIVFVCIGLYAKTKVICLERTQRARFLGLAFVVCSLTFAAAYVTSYYLYPGNLIRVVAAQDHAVLTHRQASDAMDAMLRKETGSAGVWGYAVYSQRLELTTGSLGEYVAAEFDDVDDAEGVAVASLNVMMQAIPIFLKWVLCDKLGLVSEAGLVGLAYWYVFSVTVSYVAYRS